STLLADFTAGKCHLGMGGISVNTTRAEQAFFSTPYVRNGKAPITRCENVDKFQTIEDINQPGVRVIANPGGTNEQFARANFPNAQLIIHPDNNTIHEEIVKGNADVMVTDAIETKYQAKLHPELCAVHPDEQFTFTENGYLLPLGDVKFEHYVNTWLRLAMNDGTYDKFAEPWLG
ncbi:MAG: transporter substrate-binding domain-containing protein, partial [Corynebacteriales bacterium]|nr:transporter substrate-binding domain-containing protein [Mycobacteriales bacterium]